MESKHKNYVVFKCGLNSSAAELHGDVIGRYKALSHLLLQLIYIAYIVLKRKKPTHSVEYVVYMQCTWHHKIIYIFHTFGVKYIH